MFWTIFWRLGRVLHGLMQRIVTKGKQAKMVTKVPKCFVFDFARFFERMFDAAGLQLFLNCLFVCPVSISSPGVACLNHKMA